MTNERLRELARKCWGAMDGCNGCGIAGAMHEAMRELLHDKGTTYANEHPIVVCYLDKLAQLAGRGGLADPRVYEAYGIVRDLAGDES